MTTTKAKDRRALVTGGSGDIGGAICRARGAAGHHVYMHAHAHAARAQDIVAAIRVDGAAADLTVFDITDAAATRVALDRLLPAGTIEVLVHNAGVHDARRWPE